MNTGTSLSDTIESCAAPRTAGVRGYSRVMQVIHWTTLALLLSACLAAWMIDAAGSREQAAWLVMLHRSLGMTILLMTPIRLAIRQRAGTPPLPAGLPAAQRIAARVTAGLLYALLGLQPLLGLAASQLHGDRVLLFGTIDLPAWLPANRPLAHQIFQLHGWTAMALLLLIGLHATAALYHHFVRKDAVLAGMLPGVRPLAVGRRAP
nr:cytochrome b/b6 domain-containing protein [uncultured Rhodopila sp.]